MTIEQLIEYWNEYMAEISAINNSRSMVHLPASAINLEKPNFAGFMNFLSLKVKERSKHKENSIH